MNKDVQGVIYGISLASLILSAYFFFSGRRDTGIFIGLLAPTMLSFGTFFNTEAGR
jgi:CDP-diglyceride synthetase